MTPFWGTARTGGDRIYTRGARATSTAAGRFRATVDASALLLSPIVRMTEKENPATAPAAGPAPTPDETGGRPLAPARVLVIDDDPRRLAGMRAQLESIGYLDVVECDRPERALDAVDHHRPDLVLLEHGLPEVGGPEILRRVRADAELSYVPVIMLIAGNDPVVKQQALELGATDLLVKPVDPSELVLRLRNALAFKAHHDYLAFYDGLSGLPNRRLFLRNLTTALRDAQRDRGTLALLSIGLDRFRQVNESLGHKVGDELLRTAAIRLSESVRGRGTAGRIGADEVVGAVARIGGDEFAVILPQLPQVEAAALVAQRLLSVLCRPFDVDGRELFVTASIGVAVFPHDGSDPQQLLKHADAALTHAKHRGRNTFVFYSADLEQRAVERLGLSNQLRRALERDELAIHFQPKVRADGCIVACEAMLRWSHPQLGAVSPGRFIPLAEEIGLIVPYGEWALREACRQAAEWHARGHRISVAVNVSSLQYRAAAFVAVVSGVLADTGLDPEWLVLELTESLLIESVDEAVAMMHEIRSLGPRLSLDDFGTGYSALQYLRRLPLDELKLDRSFVRGLPDDEASAAIARALVSLAKGLKMTLTAEGIEAAGEYSFLAGLGCDLFQGELFSPPVSAAAFTSLLDRGQSLGKPG